MASVVSADSSPMLSSQRSFRQHSPYATPAIPATDLSDGNHDYYHNSASSATSDVAPTNHLMLPPSVGPATPTTGSEGGDSPTAPHALGAFPPPTYEQARCHPAAPAAAGGVPTPSYLAAPTHKAPRSPGAPQRARLIGYTQPAVPEGAFHAPLAGHCEFLQVPVINPVDHQTPQFPCFRLFLGQVRFETTAADVRWIIRNTCNVLALKIEPRGTGCFLAYFRTFEEMTQVKLLHKRLLFDHTGVWFARTPAQTEAMHYYVSQYLGRVGRGFRLPKDTMVVEEEKSCSRSGNGANAASSSAASSSSHAPHYHGSSPVHSPPSNEPPHYAAAASSPTRSSYGYHGMTTYQSSYYGNQQQQQQQQQQVPSYSSSHDESYYSNSYSEYPPQAAYPEAYSSYHAPAGDAPMNAGYDGQFYGA